MTELISWTQQTSGTHTEHIGTPKDLMNELVYNSYRRARDAEPEVAPERWTGIFPAIPALEARYQAERHAKRY